MAWTSGTGHKSIDMDRKGRVKVGQAIASRSFISLLGDGHLNGENR